MGVQFAPVVDLRGPVIAEYWADHLRPRFPNAVEAAPLNPAIEWFGFPPNPVVSMSVTFGAPSSRWMLTDDQKNHLIQIQQDRFVCNWRKVGKNDAYPRYESIRGKFQADFLAFSKFVSSSGFGTLIPTQCEVTYVNRIVLEDTGQVGNLKPFFAPWTGSFSDDFLGPPESVEVQSHHLISGARGEPVGRLHVSIQPAYSVEDSGPSILLQLTARGRPGGESIDDILGFLDLGREQVVRGFSSVTTTDAHKKWGRRDGYGR